MQDNFHMTQIRAASHEADIKNGSENAKIYHRPVPHHSYYLHEQDYVQLPDEVAFLQQFLLVVVHVPVAGCIAS